MITNLLKQDLGRYLYTEDENGDAVGGRLKEYNNAMEVAVLQLGSLSTKSSERIVRYEYLELPGFLQ